jgi:tetratricopeptide (TPR) repeat protein
MRLGELCAGIDLVDKALTHYGAAAALDQTDHRSWWAMARLHEGKGRLREAAEAYAEAVAREPDAGDVYFEAGLVQKKLREYGRAAELFKRATKKSPGLGSAYTQLATVSALHFLDRSTAQRMTSENPNGADRDVSVEVTQ